MDEPQNEVTESSPAKARFRRRGIYLLPNAITISSLFCGFYAIVMSLNLEFRQATVAIFIRRTARQPCGYGRVRRSACAGRI